MPLLRDERDAATPSKPHLALLINEKGQRLEIPPGASLWVVEDASDPQKIFPFILKSVSHSKLVFELQTKDGGSTEYVYKVEAAKLKAAKHQKASVKLKRSR